MKNIKFIIGLGNPGPLYRNTYHNAGFLALDSLMKDLAGPASLTIKFKDIDRAFQYCKSNGPVFVKPLLPMNLSGQGIKKAMRYFGAKPEEILIVHDDSDIPIGLFKTSFSRNSAGHRGVESVIKNLNTKNFWRLRIGIRPPEKITGQTAPTRKKAGNFVMKKISAADQTALKAVFSKISGLVKTASKS